MEQEESHIRFLFGRLMMARTRKKTIGLTFRNPGGHKRAKKDGCRAVPPNPWDDISPDRQCDLPYKIAFAMHKKGLPKDKIINRLVNFHGYKRWQIIQSYWYDRGFWKCKCDNCKNYKFV